MLLYHFDLLDLNRGLKLMGLGAITCGFPRRILLSGRIYDEARFYSGRDTGERLGDEKGFRKRDGCLVSVPSYES